MRALADAEARRERAAQGSDAPAAEAAARRAGAARGAHAVLVALAVLGCLHALFLLGIEAWRYRVTADAVSRLQGSVDELRAESTDLQAVVDHAADARYREDLARLQGYMYPDEERAVTETGGRTGSGSSAPPGVTQP